MKDFVLYLLVGLPRSGKSTFAKESCGVPIVNPDSIRLAIHGQRFVSESEPFVWATAQTMVNALFLAGHDRVVLDATNTTRKRRKMWVSDKWDTKVIWVNTSMEICIDRAEAEGDKEIIPIIKSMNESFEPPTEDEGFVEVLIS